MSDLRITVGAVSDGTLTTVFRPLFETSDRAQRHVERTSGAAARAVADQGRKSSGVYRDSARAAVEGADRAAAAGERGARQEARAKERAAEHVARVRERYFREEQKRGEEADRKEEQRAAKAQSRNERVAGAAVRTFGAIMRAGAGAASSVAQGMGLDLSMSGGIAKAISRDALARNIAAQGFRDRPGEAPQDINQLQATAQAIGDKYKVDPASVLGGLGKFQALTGDLDTGKASLEGLSRLAKAFNVDLTSMMGAAGQVSSALGDVGAGKEFATAEEKAKALLDVMKGTVAQGQEGAIEIADMATQFAKLKGAGIRFEGGAGGNILKMGALAQMSYQMGGAGSVSQASNAVLGFTNTLATKARRDAFKANGVDIDSTTEKGKFKNPYELIKDSLIKTGGDTDKMKAMWGNVLGEKAVNALRTAFLQAGGGQKGLSAVDAQFARFGGSVSENAINTGLGLNMNSKASQSQDIQNQLDSAYSKMFDELQPAIRDLTPHVVSAARAFGWIVSAAANNPVTAITAAIAASIGKAAIGEAAGAALTKMIAGSSMNGGLAIGVATLTVLGVAKFIDANLEASKRNAKSDKDIAATDKIISDTLSGAGVADADKTLASQHVADLNKRVINAGAEQIANTGNPIEKLGRTIMQLFGGGLSEGRTATDVMQGRQDSDKTGELAAKYQLQSKALENLKFPTAQDIGSATASALAPLINKAGAPPGGPGVDAGARGNGPL